ncbi:hypothetical protein G6011_07545 [Alternaria panax]|uniref:Uncharacterized protein n=1 Tax=Alternaria panax TaxID=48097 RepID=A0AAD4FGA3_9PLEO|nr:hypothetical protein G6011_07545 [Alternaria panax]
MAVWSVSQNKPTLKDETRKAAGLSIQTPAFVATIDVATAKGTNAQEVIGLIKDIDTSAAQNSLNPSSLLDTRKDPVNDVDFNNQIRTLIFEAATVSDVGDLGNNALVEWMEDYYSTRQYDTSSAPEEYMRFLALHYLNSSAAVILKGVEFDELSVGQLVYLGLFVGSKKDLTSD